MLKPVQHQKILLVALNGERAGEETRAVQVEMNVNTV